MGLADLVLHFVFKGVIKGFLKEGSSGNAVAIKSAFVLRTYTLVAALPLILSRSKLYSETDLLILVIFLCT